MSKQIYALHPLQAICEEVAIWSTLKHRNVLDFLGVAMQPKCNYLLSLVSPWMKNGHLRRYLENFPHADRLKLVSDTGNSLGIFVQLT